MKQLIIKCPICGQDVVLVGHLFYRYKNRKEVLCPKCFNDRRINNQHKNDSKRKINDNNNFIKELSVIVN